MVRGSRSGVGRSRGLRRIGVLAVVAGFAVFAVPQAFAATYTVTNAGDSGTCADGCSLRGAISAANASAESDIIVFDLPAGVTTITLTSGLTISDPVTIDGRLPVSTTVGIGINAVNSAGAALTFSAGSEGSVVKGLAVYGASADFVAVGANDITISGNYIGLHEDGVTAYGNMPGIGINVTGDNAHIGGTAPGDGNVIAQTGYGIYFNGVSSGWAKQNIIGLDKNGALGSARSTRTSSASRSTTRLVSRSVTSRRTVRLSRTSSRTTRSRVSGSGAPARAPLLAATESASRPTARLRPGTRSVCRSFRRM